MIELPEALTLAKQLNDTVKGKAIERVLPATKLHKFCWFNGEASDYDAKIKGRAIISAEGFGIYSELVFEGGIKLCVNDGINLRLIPRAEAPKDYQLLIELSDGTALVFTVAMYGGIILHDGTYDNEYYLKSRGALSPFDHEFSKHYYATLENAKPALSAKAFLATEQRFPGIGNGVLQDILFSSKLHPKRKISTLNSSERDNLLGCAVSTLRDMTELGGRDTEKDLFGAKGCYLTKMSKNTLAAGCPVCGGEITKEAYLGGSVYYCPHCQPLIK